MKKFYIILSFISLITFQRAHAIVKGNINLSITTGNYFYVDHNNCGSGGGPRAAYLGIKILNSSGVSQNNISIEFVKYTDSVNYTLSGGQAASQTISSLANNANDTFFWYSAYPCFGSGSGYPTNVIFRVRDLDDNTNYLDTLTGLTTEEQISSNGGGLVGTSQITRQDPVGGIFSYKCTYNYPRLVAGDISYMQPTTNLSFDAASYQLESAVILSSTANSASCIPVGNSPMNYIVSGTCNSFNITIEYSFRIKNNINTTAYPYNSATSGAVGLKYVITTVPVVFSPSSTLPVELIGYQARIENNMVINTWTTASELNNDFFTIQRSEDAVFFDNIGEVDGSGNSNVVRNYSFIDIKPLDGISYYRLVQTDFDGKKSYSAFVAVNNKNKKNLNVNLFPNPSNGLVSLLFEGVQKSDIKIKIYDIVGHIILEKNIIVNEKDNNTELDLRGIAKGEYFIMYTADNNSKIKKFFIQ